MMLSIRIADFVSGICVIGSADNAGWTGRLIYRVDADEMSSPDALFAKRRLAGYRWRRRWNAMRSRRELRWTRFAACRDLPRCRLRQAICIVHHMM